MAGRNGQPWTPGEVEQLRRLVEAGSSAAEIASKLDRTVPGIKGKIQSTGLRKNSSTRHSRDRLSSER
jgi:hypothetical protein